MDVKKQFNIVEVLLTPFIIVYNIVVYALFGVKAVFYDLLVNLFNGFSYQADKALRASKQMIASEEEKIYELTKKKPKREKVYTYSPKYLLKLEEEKRALAVDLQAAGATRSKTVHVYMYTVKNQKGQIIKDHMNGLSKLDVNAYLTNEGYEVYSIKTSPWIDFLFKESNVLGKKMSTKDLIFTLTQISTYVKSGLTLNDSIKILASQMKKKDYKIALKSISYELTLGESFSVALEKQGNMFPALLINMIKAAEATGTLTETLDDMVEYYTELNETHKQMVSAMTYPAIIFFFSIGVVIFIMIWVVPQFVDIYNKNNAEVTGLTLFVINMSNFLKHNYLLLFAITIGVVITIIILYKTVKAFKTTFQLLLMRIPILKDLIMYNELAIFSKTFSSLLNNNVFITESMDILSKITNNEIYRAIMYKTINNIVKGEKISEAFKDHWAIPDVAYYMIVTGESTGELGNMMAKVSDYYQLSHKNLVNNLKSFIEPVMIVFLAAIVGGIVIAVIVPIFGMYSQVTY